MNIWFTTYNKDFTLCSTNNVREAKVDQQTAALFQHVHKRTTHTEDKHFLSYSFACPIAQRQGWGGTTHLLGTFYTKANPVLVQCWFYRPTTKEPAWLSKVFRARVEPRQCVEAFDPAVLATRQEDVKINANRH